MGLDSTYLIGGLCVGAVVILALVARLMGGNGNSKAADETKDLVLTLTRAAAKWKSQAEQDTDVLLRLMHYIYADGYIKAIRQVMNDAEVQKLAGIDVRDMADAIDAKMTSTVAKITKASPKLRPSGEHVLNTGWLG